MTETSLFEAEGAELKSLYPPEIKFDGPNGELNLKYVRQSYSYDVILGMPEEDIEVRLPGHSPDAAEKVLQAVRWGNSDLTDCLRIVTDLPQGIHKNILRAVNDIPKESIEVLKFLRELHQGDCKWFNESAWLFDKSYLLAVKAEGSRKAEVSAASLAGNGGSRIVRSLILKGVEQKNFKSDNWQIQEAPRSCFNTVAEMVGKKGYEKVAKMIEFGASYKTRRGRMDYIKVLRQGFSEKEFRERKRKAENVRKRREREDRYEELYRKFEERRYKYLPDENEILIYPNCVASLGLEVEFQKIVSDKKRYHIGSRIHTGRWPPSVEFEPKSKFHSWQFKKLRKSIKKAVDEIPEGAADRLRAYAVDWVLSEDT